MPQNKNALIRHRIIDECLRDRSKDWTLEDIINEVSRYFIDELGKSEGISKRTIEYDIDFMQSSEGYMAPIEKEKVANRWIWYYTDSKYSIKNSPLDKNDAEKLKAALIILKEFEDFPQFQDLQEMIIKLQAKTITYNASFKPIIQFEKNLKAEGNRFLRGLYEVLLKSVSIKIFYKPFNKPEREFVFHPFLLKEYSNRWFIIGKIHGTDFITNLALDRILSFDISNEPFIDEVSFNPDEYFKNVIGVSIENGKKTEIIILSFKPDHGNYIRTKPIHHSQRILQDNKKEFRIELLLIPNFELKKMLLSLGDGLKIISPKNLLKLCERGEK